MSCAVSSGTSSCGQWPTPSSSTQSACGSQSVLRPSKTTSYCPYKGDAGYFSADSADQEPLEDVAWFYAEPYAWVAEIADYVAFYSDRAEVLILDG